MKSKFWNFGFCWTYWFLSSYKIYIYIRCLYHPIRKSIFFLAISQALPIFTPSSHYFPHAALFFLNPFAIDFFSLMSCVTLSSPFDLQVVHPFLSVEASFIPSRPAFSIGALVQCSNRHI